MQKRYSRCSLDARLTEIPKANILYSNTLDVYQEYHSHFALTYIDAQEQVEAANVFLSNVNKWNPFDDSAVDFPFKTCPTVARPNGFEVHRGEDLTNDVNLRNRYWVGQIIIINKCITVFENCPKCCI